MTMHKFTEAQLRDYFLQGSEWQQVSLFCEIPVFSRSVDLVINHLDGRITAVEFKLHDWRRALEQLTAISLCFDYLEICMPLPKTQQGKESILNKCNDMGVGVYLFDSEKMNFEHALKPKKAEKIWHAQKDTILKLCEGV